VKGERGKKRSETREGKKVNAIITSPNPERGNTYQTLKKQKKKRPAKKNQQD
jgi:hypothetical protein